MSADIIRQDAIQSLRGRVAFCSDEWWTAHDGTRAGGIVVLARHVQAALDEIDRLTALLNAEVRQKAGAA